MNIVFSYYIRCQGAKLKRYVRKGVPSCHRRGVWLEVSGAAKLRLAEPDLYPTMLAMEVTSTLVDDQIRTRAVNDSSQFYSDSGEGPNFMSALLCLNICLVWCLNRFLIDCESASRPFQQVVGVFYGHCNTSQRFVNSSNQDGPPPHLPQQRPLRQHGARLLPGAALQHPAGLRQQQPRHRLLPGTQLHRGAALPGHQGRGRQLLAAEGYLRDHLAGILHRIHARLGFRALYCAIEF